MATSDPVWAESTDRLYDEEYYNQHCGPRPYVKGDPVFISFYGQVADQIVRSLRPRTVFDAGCAIGFLVEALWDRSVEAYGRDISKYAIEQIRPDVRRHCAVGSITDSLGGPYDLVICIEVLEHLSETEGAVALDRLTQAADRILFSSTPDDFEEPTHVNVQPPIYWLRQFAARGFRPVLSYDVTYICHWALLFERSPEPIDDELLTAGAELVRLRMAGHELGTTLDAERQRTTEMTGELSRLRHVESDLAAARSGLARQIAQNEGERSRIEKLGHELHQAVLAAAAAEQRARSIEQSVFWRASSPARWVLNRIPRPIHRLLRRAAKLTWLIVTLRIVRVLGNRVRARRLIPTSASVATTHERPAPTARWVERALPHLRSLNVYPSPATEQTINMVTDSIAPGWLYGGVGTGIILSAMVAKATGSRLRIVTQTEPGDLAQARRLLSINGIEFDGTLELLHAPRDGEDEVPVGDGDVFLTTSWWSTKSVADAVGPKRLVYLLQEDERMFYPYGDERLRCEEVLGEPGIHLLVNSGVLFDHFASGSDAIPGFRERAIAFEPAFPETIYYDDPVERSISGKRNFLFYGRPHNARNLYWRGMEALEMAILRGTLQPGQTRFLFVGKDLPEPELPGNPEWENYENLSWGEYARLIRSAHVGMSLIYTPHSSYPPLDLAASGAVVVTNRFGAQKTDLSSYSKNIIMADPSPADLARGIANAVILQEDPATRLANYRSAGIRRSWEETLRATVEHVISVMDLGLTPEP